MTVEPLEGRCLCNADMAGIQEVATTQAPVVQIAMVQNTTAQNPTVQSPMVVNPAAHATTTAEHQSNHLLPTAMFGRGVENSQNDDGSGGVSPSPDELMRQMLEEDSPFTDTEGRGEHSEEDANLAHGDEQLDLSDEFDLSTAVAPTAPRASLMDGDNLKSLIDRKTPIGLTFEDRLMTTSARVHLICDAYFGDQETSPE